MQTPTWTPSLWFFIIWATSSFSHKKSILNYFGLIHQPRGIVLIYHFQFIIISAIPQQAFQGEDGD